MEITPKLTDFKELETRYRANLINSLSGFKSACLVGSVNTKGVYNLAIFNSVFHIGANPPLMGIVFRPDNGQRHTLENIRKTEYFTINHIHESIIVQAHQTSAKYGEDLSEFDETGLTPDIGTLHPAPYVEESVIRIGLKLNDELPVIANGTIILIAEIVELFLPTECLDPDGTLNLSMAGTVAISGLDGYFRTEKICRLSYARPGKFSEVIG